MNASGVQLAVDTAGAPQSGWDSSVVAVGSGITVSFDPAYNLNGQRTVLISGVHIKAVGGKSTLLWDQTVSSGSLNFVGQGATRRVRAAGTLTVQNNVDKYTAFVAITQDLGYRNADGSACPYPTSGQLTASFTGSRSDSETLTFNGTCGVATLTSGKTTSSVQLAYGI